jgi:hypothetical protein
VNQLRRAIALCSGLGGAILLVMGRGCGGQGVSPGADADTREATGFRDAQRVSTTDAALFEATADALGCQVPMRRPGVPVDWDFYADLHCSCELYVPSSPSALPPPVAWKACDAVAQPQGIACRQMIEDWPPDAYGSGISGVAPGYARPDGTVVMQISRFTGSMVYRLIAEADGRVYQAILEANPPDGCTLGNSDLADGKYVFFVYPNGGLEPVSLAALAGDVTDFRQRVFLDFADSTPGTRDFAAGLPGVLELTTGQWLILHDWADASKTTFIWSPAQDNGLQQTGMFFRGDALFWSASSLHVGKIKAYTAASGVKDLVAFGTGSLKAADDLGTDGHDLVWDEADGRADSGAHATASVMTSPFATDPAAVVPRRLRSDSGSYFGVQSFKVGCGYAARFTLLGDIWGVLIVRLADGQSWFLANTTTAWNWLGPIAVTCSEVFAVVTLGGVNRTIARVRIDSLGTAIPPD